MPKFVTGDEFYRIIQRELPPDTFPDGAPSAFYHTADVYSVAQRLGDACQNLSGIYFDTFPQSTRIGRIGDHEIKVFGYVAEASLSLQERIDRVLVKLRTRRGITLNDIAAIVISVFPTWVRGVDFELWEWSHGHGMWQLEISQLEVETGLDGNGQALALFGPFLCDDTPESHGMTQDEWNAVRATAYTLEVRIYNHTLTTLERAALQNALDQFGRGTVRHIITDGLTDADRNED